jgi:hypothetical protein
MRMIGHPEQPADHGSDSIERPSIGRESRFQSPLQEEFQETMPLLVIQSCGTSSPGLTLQVLQALGTAPNRLGPGTDGSTTDPQAVGDLGLREPALEQEPPAFPAAFFKLDRS